MIRNYFTIAWRNLRQHKAYSTLNISGLAVGLATTILILLWMNNELGYDQFHENRRQLYSVKMHMEVNPGEIVTHPAMPQPLAMALKAEVPEIAYATRTTWGDPSDTKLFSYQDKTIEEKGLHVDPDFLRMFSFPLLQGNLQTALTEPYTVLITEKLAHKYFGQNQPLGKVIRVNQEADYKVVGVLKDIPTNSSLQFDFLMPFRDKFREDGPWGNNNTPTYVQLQAGVNAQQVNLKIKDFIAHHRPEAKNEALFLHANADWYLRSEFKNGQFTGGGRIVYVRLFGVIAFLVLLIACINFVNLSTARASRRAKEVGVRKAVGATKEWLIGQFLGESLLITLLAGLLAVGLVLLILPSFNDLLQKQLSLLNNPWHIPVFVLLLILTGLLAGFYPAFVLSSFQPIRILKGLQERISNGALWLRQSLVVIQFATSILLVIGTLIIYQQIQYIQQMNLGYQKENLIWFDAKGLTAGSNADHYEQARAGLAIVAGVRSLAVSNNKFQGPENSRQDISWPGKQAGNDILFDMIHGDYDLLPTLGMQLKAGRNFSRSFTIDTANVIINEEAARQMKLGHPVGHPITVGDLSGTIVGVVKDFNLASVHNPIRPAIIRCRPWRTWLFFARIDGQNVPETINRLQTAYQKLRPGYPLNYHFVDQEYEKLYRSEIQIGQLANWFSGLAFLISCLGLFGLASFTVERRTKEIGVRKVLGASLASVFTLVAKDFLKPVIVALLVASPLAWWAMHQWLNQFAYKVDIAWWVFVLAGVVTIGSSLLTVSFQSIKAALMNPVKSLRSE